MKVRIVNFYQGGPTYPLVFHPGETWDLGEGVAKNLIDRGFAEAIPERKVASSRKKNKEEE